MSCTYTFESYTGSSTAGSHFAHNTMQAPLNFKQDIIPPVNQSRDLPVRMEPKKRYPVTTTLFDCAEDVQPFNSLS